MSETESGELARLAGLISLASDLDVSEDYLDEVVYELSCELVLAPLNATGDDMQQERIIDEAERSASDINNEGIVGQLEFLLEHNPPEIVEHILRQGRAGGG